MTNEELVEQIQAGIDVQGNMGILYEQNKSFIHKLALPYSKFVEVEDLMQEGYFGLEKAVKKFNPNKEFKFLTYAEWTIRGAMQRYCYEVGNSKRIPVHMITTISKYYKILSAYQNEYSDYPSDDYIQQKLNIDKKQLKALRKTINECNSISIDDKIPGTELTFGSSIADEHDFQDELIQNFAEEQMNLKLWESVDELDPKLKDIICSRYKENMTQAEIANKYGISDRRISQYEHKAYRLLKAKEAVQNVAEFYGFGCSVAYHGSLKFFKQKGMSSTEYLAMKKIECEEKENKVNKLLDNMVWEV